VIEDYTQPGKALAHFVIKLNQNHRRHCEDLGEAEASLRRSQAARNDDAEL